MFIILLSINCNASWTAQPESFTTAVGKIMWCHCSETTSTAYVYGSGSCSSCVWWCTGHFLAWHRLTSPNFAFPSLQFVRGLHCGQLLMAHCLSRALAWNSASARSPSPPQLLGTVSLATSGARQHLTNLNSAWKPIFLYSQITHSQVSVELSQTTFHFVCKAPL